MTTHHQLPADDCNARARHMCVCLCFGMSFRLMTRQNTSCRRNVRTNTYSCYFEDFLSFFSPFPVVAGIPEIICYIKHGRTPDDFDIK